MTAHACGLGSAARSLVRITGSLARHCDRAEHNEQASRDVITGAAAELRDIALAQLREHGAEPLSAYACRLARIEARHPLAGAGLFEAAQQIPLTATWHELQQAQARHDAVYHPDVTGLAKTEQLRHCTLHLAKLTWLLRDAADDRDCGGETRDRITDLLIFGVKLSTACGQLLPGEPAG